MAMVLEYQSQAEDGRVVRRWLRAVFLGAACVAVATIFLPFTWRTSPWEVVYELFREHRWEESVLYLLGSPFLISIPLVLWKLRLLIGRRGTSVERIVIWIIFALAAAAAGGVAWHVLMQAVRNNDDIDAESMISAIGITILVGWAIGAVVIRRRVASSDVLASFALIGAYLANSIMCLVLFHDGPDIGWWITLVASAGLMAEVVVMIVAGRRGF